MTPLLIAFFGFLCFVGGFLACCWLDSTDVIAPDFCDVCSFDLSIDRNEWDVRKSGGDETYAQMFNTQLWPEHDRGPLKLGEH